jgi:hypothetical protein
MPGGLSAEFIAYLLEYNYVMSSSMIQVKADRRTISDISARAHSLAREIDRLPPGFTYTIQVVKNELDEIDWRVEIIRSEFIRRLSLRKKEYLPE